MPLSPRTEKILKRTSIGISILVGTVDFLILAFLAWFLYLVFFNETPCTALAFPRKPLTECMSECRKRRFGGSWACP